MMDHGAQGGEGVTDVLELWPGVAPGSEGATWVESELRQEDSVVVRNVVRPTLTRFRPDASVANGTAVVVAPGGGFHFLAWDYEGVEVAKWLAARGVTAFLLKYRLEDTGPTDESYAEAMGVVMQRLISEAIHGGGVDLDSLVPGVRELAYADGQEAVRLVRRRAAEWDVNPGRIGFLGFSAGAFVATAVALSDDVSARPDFVAPIYGGHAPGPVPETAPPLFAVVAADDGLCRRTCMQTAQAWINAGRPAELHVYEKGGHGFGARKLGMPVDGWMDRLADWMQSGGFL
jgi:acetyl esterase/lipase